MLDSWPCLQLIETPSMPFLSLMPQAHQCHSHTHVLAFPVLLYTAYNATVFTWHSCMAAQMKRDGCIKLLSLMCASMT